MFRLTLWLTSVDWHTEATTKYRLAHQSHYQVYIDVLGPQLRLDWYIDATTKSGLTNSSHAVTIRSLQFKQFNSQYFSLRNHWNYQPYENPSIRSLRATSLKCFLVEASTAVQVVLYEWFSMFLFIFYRKVLQEGRQDNKSKTNQIKSIPCFQK